MASTLGTAVRAAAAAASILAAQALAQDRPISPGRWVSTDYVSGTGTAKAGVRFFLDVTVAADGSFKGSWEEYVCFNYPGAYGVPIVSCSRSKKPSPASGRFDARARSGQIELARAGKTSLKFKAATTQKGQPQLDIELPRDWLKQDVPVLYETSLNPKRP